MPEATASGITKSAVRQSASHPMKVHVVDAAGNSYTPEQVLTWVQAVTDRNGG